MVFFEDKRMFYFLIKNKSEYNEKWKINWDFNVLLYIRTIKSMNKKLRTS